MTPSDDTLEQARDLLRLGDEMTADDVRRAYLKQSYELIRSGAPQEQRDRLKAAEAALLAAIAVLEQEQLAARRVGAAERRAVLQEERALAEAQRVAEWEAERIEPKVDRWDPRSFDSRLVNLIAPPVVAGIGILVQVSPLGFFLTGFHVWIHEFGHATVAWLAGYPALPVPFGWTTVIPEQSNFVYFGLLALLGLLFYSGLKEGKPMPMFAAVAIAGLQYFVTWRLPEHRVELWLAFGGVGGEFYLSAAMMALFFVRMPAKFRWGLCRYLFLFLGSGTFYFSWAMWRRIRRGEEDIPYGSMIGGEHDTGGDMNVLHHDYGWAQRKIIHAYNDLATACLIALGLVYVWFVVRPDRLLVDTWRRLTRGRGPA